MRKRLLLAVLTIVLLMSHEVVLAAAHGPLSIRLGGDGRTSQSFPVVVLPNGNMIISLYTKGGIGDDNVPSSGGYQTCLVCINPQNEILWRRYFDGSSIPGDAVVYSVCRMSVKQENELSVLLRQHTAKDGTFFLPMTLDAGSGEVMETGAMIPFDISDEAADKYVTTFNMDSLYIQQKTLHFSTVEPERTVVAYGYDNRLRWSVPADALPFGAIQTCLETPAGVLLCGMVVTPEADRTFLSHTVFAMISPDGQTLWTHTFDRKQSVNITPTLNREGHIMALGSLENNSNTAEQEDWQYLACMDSQSGAIIWERTTPFTAAAALPVGMLLMTETGYLLLGEHNGETLAESVDPLGNQNVLSAQSIEPEGDFATLQYFFRGGALWVARMGITPQHTYMQYSLLDIEP